MAFIVTNYNECWIMISRITLQQEQSVERRYKDIHPIHEIKWQPKYS